MNKRTPYVKIWQDLATDKSMIFLAGPRQAGKTTLGQIISSSFTNSLYFNWDIAEHRINFMENPTFFEAVERKDSSTPLIIFDEIHKYKDWKNYLKGIYDRFHEKYQFLVSGSGRLDLYQKGGDSLAGRYFLFHLWPFTISELGKNNRDIEVFLDAPLQITMENADELKEIWSGLSEMSGFPEPYLAGRMTTYRRWSNTYSQQLIREDIRDLTGIKSVIDMETLYLVLPSKVGSPISVPSLARDLKVSYNSIRSWLSIFERFFLIFSIAPWTRRITRAIQKERKVYLWDIPRVKEPAARFENVVALELWRAITAWNDMGYGTFSLHFIKNKEQQEVDFLIANENVPFLLIEAKLSYAQPSSALKKFQDVLKIPGVQLIKESEGYRMIPNGDQQILVSPAYQWLSSLP
ncbi:MAG: ATP-binding protein [Deltaproteobacteria bacterium]|nr:ATP-binding protein [Deltaproteobacteria bacterium]MBW1736489.1 ATP-binding protein [Deltaproteobacteria bacterium]MBW1909896.1 ATP-binding protein [Deltaproteobacteria bacterium]MBW2032838.1 ATP-binding protein [Deltaproteobacteria bacterium]MBW2113899.1 ATP-binding protein [Deltaproteobacteria bacterium]